VLAVREAHVRGCTASHPHTPTIEIIEIMMSPSSSTRPESATSAAGWPARATLSTLERVADAEHVVQLYESDRFLVACVGRFLREPLRQGGGAMVIATVEHRAPLERALDLEELSVDAAGRRGQYVHLDADETLRAILVDGFPDHRRLRDVVGTRLAALASRCSRVSVFGEMAGLLWNRGSHDGAQMLHEQWRALSRMHRFALLSGYPVGAIADEQSAAALVRMCSAYGRVLPPQRSSRVDWDEVRGRAYRARRPVGAGAAVEDSPPALPASVSSAPGRRRVLVVDDNEAVVETLSTVLTILGNEVRSAADGCDALEVASDFHPDVIFMDLGMPNMNGYDAARRIRQLPWGEGVTLVALTGWSQPEHRRRTSEAGFDEHLVKPVEVSQLRRLLEEPVAHD
jgi:CheY-like chemotaxis protein